MEKKRRSGRPAVLGVASALVLLAAAYTALCNAVKADQVLPRTVVNGVALGGMTEEEAVRVLEEEARCRREDTVVTVSFGGQEYELSVGAALEYDSRAAAEEALRPGREGFFLRGGCLLRALILGRDLVCPPAADMGVLREALELSGLTEADSRVGTTYEEEADRLVVTMGRSGKKPDEEKLLEDVREVVVSGACEKVIDCPSVTAAAEPADVEELYEKIHRDAQNAALDPDNGYEILPSVTGVDFDREYARGVLESAGEGDTVVIDLIRTEPEITTEDLEEHLFQDVLAQFSTSVGGSAGRKANIRIAVDRCNGIILNAGDEFSFNDTVGEQTAETGFQKANAILDGKIIQAYGGGICQVSTTIFEAALYAALDIPERWCHMYVSSYADPGMDAAVAWDVQDLRIVNDQRYPVKLEVTYEAGRLTATFWGTRMEEVPVEIETEVLDASGELLKVMTYRKIYSADKSHFFLEQIAYSEYLNSRRRVD